MPVSIHFVSTNVRTNPSFVHVQICIVRSVFPPIDYKKCTQNSRIFRGSPNSKSHGKPMNKNSAINWAGQAFRAPRSHAAKKTPRQVKTLWNYVENNFRNNVHTLVPPVLSFAKINCQKKSAPAAGQGRKVIYYSRRAKKFCPPRKGPPE